MEGRLKKLLHRKRDDSDLYGSAQSEHDSPGDSGLRQSLYQDTTTGAQPEMGGLPQRGNNSSIAPSHETPSYGRNQQPRRNEYANVAPSKSSYPDQAMPSRQSQHGENLSQDFGRMNLDGGSGEYLHGNVPLGLS